ncbi:MAG TPA: PASTA domain-containing protein, partial [Acidimicrobiales bacterium]|nr:PASTA domain-containing protein [Acidimicrobiales bacterium]
FGIARATRTSAEANLTQTGAVLGTATYFSPEQAEGSSVDARSDIYSLGVVLYEMLCGAPPFQGDNPVSIAYKHVREDPVPIVDRCPACPPALAAIVAKAMAKSPDQRYASADDMRTDLNRFLQGRPVAAVVDPPTQMVAATTVGAPVAPTRVGRAVTVEEETSRPTGGGRGGAYLALLLALLVILGGLIFLLARSLGLIGTTSKVSVPNVIGMNVNQAVSTLTGAGLKATEQFNDAPGTPPNNVYDQNPKPNTSVGSGSSVTLLISKGAPLVAVPNVVGQDVNSASLALQHAGFQVSTTQRADNSQPGTVLSQSPASGQAPQGSTVDLVVSSGAQQVTVPDVSGMTTAQAGNVLGQAGLTVGQSSQQASDSVPSGEVISTNPQAGTSVAKGTAVNLLVSSGPSTTTTTTSSTTTTSTTLLPSSTTTSSTTTTTRPTTTTTAP